MSTDVGSLHFGTLRLPRSIFEPLATSACETGRVIVHDGLSVFALGTASVIALDGGLADTARTRLALGELYSISPVSELQDPSLPTPAVPIALGSLPFDRHARGQLVVPELSVLAPRTGPAVAVVVGRQRRVHELLDAQSSLLGLARRCEACPPPDEFVLASARTHEDFRQRVSAALAEIATGKLDKIVLAREVRVSANRPFRQADLFERLRALHPSCTTFALDGFIGATPELLIRRNGAQVASRPLAGTTARSGDQDSDHKAAAALLGSSKDRREHQSVVEAICAALAPVTEHLDVPAEPVIQELRNVSHLATPIVGTLTARSVPYPSALELVGLIHPTPAVAGVPVDHALECLTTLEGFDRGRYAGPLGWVDARGDGEWYLGIRSAIVEENLARLFAGVGVVAGSDPASELAETQLKLQAFLAAAVRP
jgi:menaquinone-specific isochorismate synthase